MRVLIFSGSHPRHLYVHEAILKNFEVCGVVSMDREGLMPEPPAGIAERDAVNFRRHFGERLEVEESYFGQRKPREVFAGVPTRFCEKEGLNTQETREFVLAQKPDLVFVFGPGLILDPVLSALPHDKVNLHLGFSPWYRGSATLFWPFYNLEPQFCATTFHQIVPAADAGAVIHHTFPVLENGDGIHDVGAKTVVASTEDAVKLLRMREKKPFVEVLQTTPGRLYLSKHFKPEHLRVIYDLFDNNIVDAYLRGDLSTHQPKAIKAF